MIMWRLRIGRFEFSHDHLLRGLENPTSVEWGAVAHILVQFRPIMEKLNFSGTISEILKDSESVKTIRNI